MFPRDHSPPHFHVVTVDSEVQVALADLAVIRGRIRKRDLDAVRHWARDHMELLWNEWSRLNG
ncbi:MAG: DUF4160 domain-containing protein [Devosia nanyangense]|nr:DUF4160 domain-containing protein [Devosia nanyangense]QMV04098.1 DUF4160 domain-containing protein [Devosia sp. D6-9]